MRGETFVTRKITRAAAHIEYGMQDCLYLGNLDAKRDWGHARDYAEGMWRILQQPEPDDYVLATGESHSVREFAELAFMHTGRQIVWSGKGVDEIGKDLRTGQVLSSALTRLIYRPAEIDLLQGDPRKAHEKLGWRHRTPFPELVSEMVPPTCASQASKKAAARQPFRTCCAILSSAKTPSRAPGGATHSFKFRVPSIVKQK